MAAGEQPETVAPPTHFTE